MQIPVLAWVFQSIPECIAMAALVLVLGTRELPWKKIFVVGFAHAIVAYFIRMMPFTPGVHVIVLAASLGIISIFLGGLEMRRGMVYSAIAMALLVLTEMVCVYAIFSLNIFTIDQLANDITARIIGGTPHTILIFIYAIIVRRKKISLEFLFRPRGYWG